MEAGTERIVGAAGNPVWELALGILDTTPRGRALDAAAGGGQLTRALLDRGFQVVGGDLVHQFQGGGAPFVRQDLDDGLPFAGETFELVLLVEALGYLESPARFIREARRVLVPGGRLLITVPNILSLQSRMRFLLNGTYRWFPHPGFHSDDKQALADIYRDPIRVTTLEWLLRREGFTVESVGFGGARVMGWLRPVGWMLQLILKGHNAARKGRKQTPAFVNGNGALYSANVGILAKKGP